VDAQHLDERRQLVARVGLRVRRGGGDEELRAPGQRLPFFRRSAIWERSAGIGFPFRPLIFASSTTSFSLRPLKAIAIA
jgi:hypothetical protein